MTESCAPNIFKKISADIQNFRIGHPLGAYPYTAYSLPSGDMMHIPTLVVGVHASSFSISFFSACNLRVKQI
jgi:hypothetical protein